MEIPILHVERIRRFWFLSVQPWTSRNRNARCGDVARARIYEKWVQKSNKEKRKRGKKKWSIASRSFRVWRAFYLLWEREQDIRYMLAYDIFITATRYISVHIHISKLYLKKLYWYNEESNGTGFSRGSVSRRAFLLLRREKINALLKFLYIHK